MNSMNTPWSSQQTWEDGYLLKASVYDFSKDVDLKWPTAVMTQGDVPVTAHHMSVVESYPNIYDAIHGHYQ